MALLVAAASGLATFSASVVAVEPITYSGRYDGTAQQGPIPDPCPNKGSIAEALSCACTAWSSSASVCPGLYTLLGNGLVPDQSGKIYKCSGACDLPNSGLKVSASATCAPGLRSALTDAGSLTCVVPGDPSAEENLGNPNPEDVCPTPNPIHPRTGNKFRVETDYVGPGPMPLRFIRTYNGDSAAAATAMGARWAHTYERRLRLNGLNVRVYRPDGSASLFTSTSIWLPFSSLSNRHDVLERIANQSGQTIGWKLSTYPNDETEEYDVSGTLVAIRNRPVLETKLRYSDSTTAAAIAPAPGFLIRVEDPMGRALEFVYDAKGRMRSMTDLAGPSSTFSYEHDDLGNLVAAINPDGTTRRYHYGEPDLTSGAHLPYSMTGITDENGTRFANFGYDAQGRAIQSELAGGTERVEIAYLSGGASAVKNYVTPALSSVRTYGFSNVNGIAKNETISGDHWPGCGPKARSFDNATGFITSATDWNNHVTAYEHDPARGLEISRTDASGRAEARTVTTEWHPSFRLPTRIGEPGREIVREYDAAGNLLIHKVSDLNSGETRAWAFSYNPNGQVVTADGPRIHVSDVTTYTYYPNDDPDFGKRGNLATIANAVGHVTRILAYNAHGQPTKIADPNGLVTTLQYDLRQRAVARTQGAETTRYEYDGVGLLTRVTLPDGSTLAYTYDPAHRLTSIADSLGNRIAYALDAMGNRTQEEVFADSGALARIQTRVYSGLNRLAQEIGAKGQATGFEYDGQGNIVSVTAPLSRIIAQNYDALDRLIKQTDPKGGEIHYGYDRLDRLVSVTDPRLLTTRYEYNALGDLKREESPDTGVTTQSLDAAGNILTRTNGNETSATSEYDALNRVTRTVYSDGQIETFAYDQGENGLGRLTGISDSSGTTAYAYDAHGRVIRETRTIGEQSYVTAYSYDAAGRLASTTTPSGRVFGYARDTLGRVTQIDTSGNNLTQVLVQGVTYFPFGGVKSFSYGSLASYTRAIDDDGRIAAYSRANENRTLLYDEASRITAIRDPGNAANDATYGYDELDRLTGWTQGTTSQAYDYDATGNRTSLAIGGASYSYSVDSASNRLNGVAGPTNTSYSHDAAGNLLSSSDTGNFTHDARLRLVRATLGNTTTDYRLNALGQRVAKLDGSGSTHYHYDAAGRLVAESDAAGRVQKEYVWLGTTPVAVIDSAAPVAAICPATPQLRPPGGFTPYERRERMEVHSGRPGERGWEWGLGANTRDFEASAREDIDWVSGKPYTFQLTYDGMGNASVRVTDADKELFTLTWTGDMDVGNALRFVVRSREGIGAGNRIQVNITSIDGHPVTETLATAGDDSFSREARIFASESLKDGYTVEGTVTFAFQRGYPPRGNRLDFHVTAGNVACDPGSGDSDAQAKIYYIHPDHLDTPRVLTDDTNRVVWRWDSDPFGAYPADEDPDGDGAKVTLNLRLPGQYFDRETNLHYNYFRDYDPSTGRYVQSDPIGLGGGLNTYLYVGGNPISYVDPTGEFGVVAFGVGVFTAVALWALPELLLPDVPVPPGSGVVYPATFPDGSGLLRCVAALGVLRSAGQTLAKTGAGSAGGRLGNQATRQHVDQVATEMERRGWTVTRGGQRGPEEYLPGPEGARKGSSYPDITATKNGRTLRVNTIDTLVDNLTPTAREAVNVARIRAQTGGHLLVVPKP